FSQSSGRNASLNNLCINAAVDVIILGFVRSFTDTGGYPTIDFAHQPANASAAPGLAVCKEFGQRVKQCQQQGKNIFVSISDSASNTTFAVGKKGRKEAQGAAGMMWNLFGEGKGSLLLRPFGPNVVVDGFNLDHEQGSFDNHDVFISRLRSYRNTASKPIFISAAPVCTLTNRITPEAVIVLVDFIFIRFYNSAACALGTPSFPPSLEYWYQTVVPSPYAPFPKYSLEA
ncbi:glycoside hydrolase, partial [Bimuria novae-zelandiae CBS 107.79]